MTIIILNRFKEVPMAFLKKIFTKLKRDAYEKPSFSVSLFPENVRLQDQPCAFNTSNSSYSSGHGGW